MAPDAVAKFRWLSYGGNIVPALPYVARISGKGELVPEKVAYMQKITLSLEYGGGLEPKRETAFCPPVEFVYGLSASGLTPLEFALAEKTVGDEIQLQLHQRQVPVFFGHIRFPASIAAGPADEIFLKARILDISPASSREVVRTLADIANCGDSCCGHHLQPE